MSQSKQLSLEDAIARLRLEMQSGHKKTVRSYESTFKEILDFSASFTENEENVVVKFYEEKFKVPAFVKPEGSKTLVNQAGKVIRIHILMFEGRFVKRILFLDVDNNPWWFEEENAFAIWLDGNNYATQTIYTMAKNLRLLFYFMDQNGIGSIEELVIGDFLDFLKYLENKGLRRNTMGNVLKAVRAYLRSPLWKQKNSCNPLPLLSIRSSRHERISSAYTPEEIRKMIECIDTSNIEGKQLYAVILLAAVYGIRGTDILNLKLSDIDWEGNRMHFIQHKTKVQVDLPLLKEVRYAILDWICNGRPETDFDNIIIRIKAPHVPYLTACKFSQAVTKCFTDAGVDISTRHHGLHSLRHSLATDMSSNDVAGLAIRDTLGHTSIASTAAYIWSDIDHLRLVSQEVPLC